MSFQLPGTPALLLVFMEPGEQVTEEEFHEWYGSEHIPLRTESLSGFRTAARYKGIDGSTPKYAAMYTIADASLFKDPEYTKLRENRSPREADIVKRLATLDRRIYHLITDTTPLPGSLRPSSIASNIVVANSFTPAADNVEAFSKWYEDEYIPALKEVPGWNRTRRFELVDSGVNGISISPNRKDQDPPKYLEISEFDALSSLHSPNFPSDTAGSEVISNVSHSERRVLKLIKSYEPTAALKAVVPGTPLVWSP